MVLSIRGFQDGNNPSQKVTLPQEGDVLRRGGDAQHIPWASAHGYSLVPRWGFREHQRRTKGTPKEDPRRSKGGLGGSRRGKGGVG